MRMKILLLTLMLIIIGGCVATKMDDGTTKWSLLPEWGKKVEGVTEGALGIMTVLAPFLGPVGGAVVGGLATGRTILKKVRPKLAEAQDKYELSNTVATITVDVFEQIKKDHPEVWKQLAGKLQQECKDSGLNTKLVKNAIRGLRGKPPKA